MTLGSDRPWSQLRDRAGWFLQGEWPAFLATGKRRRASRNPVTYTQKCQYKFARDRRPLLTTLSDKLGARDYVAERVGPEVLVPLLAHGRSPEAIPWTDLPREFVCKVNHGSGGTVVVSDLADPDARMPPSEEVTGWCRLHVRPEAADPAALARISDFWLGLRYSWVPGYYREWGYANVSPQVFVEELCRGATGLPVELKVFCFNGVPRVFVVMEVPTDLDPHEYTTYFEDEGHVVAERLGLDTPAWERLVAHCRALSGETDMIRVDWMVTERGIRFSELTNYPGAGSAMHPSHGLSWPQLDALYGSFWQVPRRYR